MKIKEIETMYYLATAEVAEYLWGVTYEQRNTNFALLCEDKTPDWYKTIRVIERRTGNYLGVITVYDFFGQRKQNDYNRVVFGYIDALGEREVPDDSIDLFDKFAVEELGLLPDDESNLAQFQARKTADFIRLVNLERKRSAAKQAALERKRSTAKRTEK